jgi:hypothetical protein
VRRLQRARSELRQHQLREQVHVAFDGLTLFVLANMVEALAHGADLRRPPRLSLGAAKEEAVRAVLAYLRS